MKKRYILFSFLLLLVSMFTVFTTQSSAADLDEIVNFVVTVDPRMNDGSLDIIYEITWKVLDSTTEGPLSWVTIGTPNANFDNARAITPNIKSITKYNGSNVKIVLDKNYYAGETLTFKYAIHQSYMYKISGNTCKYEFTPAWFTDAKVDSLTIKWNSDSVKSNDSILKEDNYLVWKKSNMSKGSKLKATIKYDKTAFSALNTAKQNRKSINISQIFSVLYIFVIIFIIVLAFMRGGGGGGYYSHRGFYGGPHIHYHSGCVRSSCACACASSCASSCACACAGSGRAGCSKKDFYGTNLNTKKIKEAMKENKSKEKKE